MKKFHPLTEREREKSPFEIEYRALNISPVFINKKSIIGYGNSIFKTNAEFD